jgi:hypothetical protein
VWFIQQWLHELLWEKLVALVACCRVLYCISLMGLRKTIKKSYKHTVGWQPNTDTPRYEVAGHLVMAVSRVVSAVSTRGVWAVQPEN